MLGGQMSGKWQLSESLWWAYFGIGVLVGTILAGFLMLPGAQQVLGDRALWLGTGGVVSAAVSVFTLVGVFAAGVGVYLNQQNSYELKEEGRKIERTQRFQKGTELLTGESLPAQFVGVKMLNDLATEHPTEFRALVISALSAAATHSSASEYKKARDAIIAGDANPFDFAVADVKIGPTIIIALSKILDEHLEIGSLYTGYFSFFKIDLRYIRLINYIMYRCEFLQVDLSSGNMHLFADEDLEFKDSNLSEMSIESTQKDTGPIKFTECDLKNANIRLENRTLEFVRCQMDGADVTATNVVIQDCWTDKAPPSIKLKKNSLEMDRFIHVTSEGDKYRESDRGFQVLIPGKRKPKKLTISAI